jgi:hypothetical protein
MPFVLLAIVLYFVIQQHGATIPAGAASANGIGPGGAGCGPITNALSGTAHVERKNAIAPTVISKYTGLPKSVSTPIAQVAGKLDVSAYAEKYVGDKFAKFLCSNPLGTIEHAAAAGAKFVGKEIAAGAAFVGKEAVAGTKFLAKSAVDPTVPFKAATGVTKVISSTAGLTDRIANRAYAALPTPLKYAAAPALAVEKVTATVTKKVAGAAGKVTGALQSGAKSAEHALSSGVHAVLGFL